MFDTGHVVVGIAGTWTELTVLLRELPYGKRLVNAVYVHRDTPVVSEDPLRSVLANVCRKHSIQDDFNVLKLRTDAARLSLLLYPTFYNDPHPALAQSVALDLESGTVYRTSYAHNPNPPILHRKELMLAPDNDRRGVYERLTKEEEDAGLYRNPAVIGFRANWQRLLALAGVTHEGHTLLRVRTADPTFLTERPTVHRHKTALTRYDLSKPIKSVLEYSQLRNGDSLFDYGCGLGSDVRALRELGFTAAGWDPVHAPDAELLEADVVNLGFVLNVIEDPEERRDTLLQAWHLARRLLVVSTLIQTGGGSPAGPAYKDGVLTNRKTFQKYFRQKELQEYLESTLGVSSVPVALGVFFVFRDDLQHQAFLEARSRRRLDLASLEHHFQKGESPIRQPKPVRARRPSKIELHRDLLEDFWRIVLSLGREPEPSEFERASELLEHFGSTRRALNAILDDERREMLASVQSSKRDDLLVYLASANLRTRLPQHHLPEDLRRNVKFYFGGYQAGLKEGLNLLKSAASPQTILLACDETDIGWQDSEALYLHTSLIDRLPPVLRVYIACGELLFGSAREAEIVKIHKGSGKITFLAYQGFEDVFLPRLLTRTKVNLRTGSLEAYDHSPDGQILYYKERFIAPDHPHSIPLLAIADKLREMGISDQTFLGPPAAQFRKLASEQGVDVAAVMPEDEA